MTFAPATILAARAYLKGRDSDLSDPELGIVGGPSHVATGTSYHLGADQLKPSRNPYSARAFRDRNGLSNAASALDIDDDLNELRALSVWLVEECRRGASDTLDVREIIYSPNGFNVLRWDRERGQGSAPFPDNDLSHRTHTHISWYRDSEFRDKVGMFRRFFETGGAMADIRQDDWDNLRWRQYDVEVAMNDVATGGPAAGQPLQQPRALKRIEAKLDQLSAPQPVPVDIAALVAALTPVIRKIVRDELDATKLGPVA